MQHKHGPTPTTPTSRVIPDVANNLTSISKHLELIRHWLNGPQIYLGLRRTIAVIGCARDILLLITTQPGQRNFARMFFGIKFWA